MGDVDGGREAAAMGTLSLVYAQAQLHLKHIVAI